MYNAKHFAQPYVFKYFIAVAKATPKVRIIPLPPLFLFVFTLILFTVMLTKSIKAAKTFV